MVEGPVVRALGRRDIRCGCPLMLTKLGAVRLGKKGLSIWVTFWLLYLASPWNQIRDLSLLAGSQFRWLGVGLL